MLPGGVWEWGGLTMGEHFLETDMGERTQDFGSGLGKVKVNRIRGQNDYDCDYNSAG